MDAPRKEKLISDFRGASVSMSFSVRSCHRVTPLCSLTLRLRLSLLSVALTSGAANQLRHLGWRRVANRQDKITTTVDPSQLQSVVVDKLPNAGGDHSNPLLLIATELSLRNRELIAHVVSEVSVPGVVGVTYKEPAAVHTLHHPVDQSVDVLLRRTAVCEQVAIGHVRYLLFIEVCVLDECRGFLKYNIINSKLQTEQLLATIQV